MNLLFLTLRGNIIGDSVRETALAKKFINDFSKKHHVNKDEIKVYYPCGSLIYGLLKRNKYLNPFLINEFDLLNKKEISRFKKLFLTIKGSLKIIKLLKSKNVHTMVYLGKLYKIREWIAKSIAKIINSRFVKSGFEEAGGYSAELNFEGDDENVIKKYDLDDVRYITINLESRDKTREYEPKFLKEILKIIPNNYKVAILGLKNKYLIKSQRTINCIGFNLIESSIIIKHSDLYIGVNSGFAHIAAAVGTDLLVLIKKDGLKNNPIVKEDIFNNPRISKKFLMVEPSIKYLSYLLNELLEIRCLLDVDRIHDGKLIEWHDGDKEFIDYLSSDETLKDIITKQHSFNYNLWHTEDIARKPNIDGIEMIKVKRSIDRLNQLRNDYMEKIDLYLHKIFYKLKVYPDKIGDYNSETLGSMVDKLSILSLKIYHMREQCLRKDVGNDHIEKSKIKLERLKIQMEQLKNVLLSIINLIFNGERGYRLYYQFKMYNDPKLNPMIYNGNKPQYVNKNK